MPINIRKLVDSELAKQEEGAKNQLVAVEAARQAITDKAWLPGWSVSIISAWQSEGEKNMGPNIYNVASLGEAIRQAATDFCRLNRRVIPGQPMSTSKTGEKWEYWDVQGTFYVSLRVGPIGIPIDRARYSHHVKALERPTKKDYFTPPKKRAPTRIP